MALTSGPQLELSAEESQDLYVLHFNFNNNKVGGKKNPKLYCCTLQPPKYFCKCVEMDSKIMFLLNVDVLVRSGGIY